MQWAGELRAKVAPYFDGDAPKPLMDVLHGFLEREYAEGYGDGFESGVDAGYQNGFEDRGRYQDV